MNSGMPGIDLLWRSDLAREGQLTAELHKALEAKDIRRAIGAMRHLKATCLSIDILHEMVMGEKYYPRPSESIER